MDRRAFLRTSGALPMAASGALMTAWAPGALAQHKDFVPLPGTWRTYEVTTRVEILKPAGVTRVWVPVPSVDSEFQRTQDSQFKAPNASAAEIVTDGKYGARILRVDFAENEKQPVVELVSRFQAQDRALDWNRKAASTETAATLAKWVAATELMPTDGIVRDTALEATRGRTTDLERVQALYDWVVNNTYREPKVRGCGVGDIKAMLETKNFGGKCGDINALFVGLARALGIPARDVYGIRVAPSAFGYKALGVGSPNITRAQHCRAEVHLADYGWVAMDPADVGKVMREETADWIKTTGHPLVVPVHKRLFGGWEGNWLAYNLAHDVALPGAKGPKIGFFMYPNAETAEARLDSLDPDSFKYVITARELKSA